jgi:hypothetical protein
VFRVKKQSATGKCWIQVLTATIIMGELPSSLVSLTSTSEMCKICSSRQHSKNLMVESNARRIETMVKGMQTKTCDM